MGIKKDDPDFWKAAEFLDTKGPHHLHEIPEIDAEKYLAYQAYSAEHRIPRMTEVTDITSVVHEYLGIVDKVIDGDEQLITAGKNFSENRRKQIEDCLMYENSNMRIFYSPEGIFCSAAYYSKEIGGIIPATITLSGKSNSILLAMEDGGETVSAREMVQELWDEAGGHNGIAGSPRGQEMTKKDLFILAQRVNNMINKVKGRKIPFEMKERLRGE